MLGLSTKAAMLGRCWKKAVVSEKVSVYSSGSSGVHRGAGRGVDSGTESEYVDTSVLAQYRKDEYGSRSN